MKKLIVLLLMAFTTQTGIANNNASGKDTIPVELSKNITVNWSIKNAKVVQDELFMKIKAARKNIKAELYELMADATPLDFEACFKKGMVKKGDVAFYLFDLLFNVPYEGAIGQKFPDFLLSCTPPVGLYDYIEANRNQVAASLKAFYTK
jgi:hypothetical protein